jgi:hypothetical protein
LALVGSGGKPAGQLDGLSHWFQRMTGKQITNPKDQQCHHSAGGSQYRQSFMPVSEFQNPRDMRGKYAQSQHRITRHRQIQ